MITNKPPDSRFTTPAGHRPPAQYQPGDIVALLDPTDNRAWTIETVHHHPDHTTSITMWAPVLGDVAEHRTAADTQLRLLRTADKPHGTGCHCHWLGPHTPEHTPNPLCRPLRPDADRDNEAGQ